MYFGAEYGVKIASRPGEGTQVTIVIPAVHNVTAVSYTHLDVYKRQVKETAADGVH